MSNLTGTKALLFNLNAELAQDTVDFNDFVSLAIAGEMLRRNVKRQFLVPPKGDKELEALERYEEAIKAYDGYVVSGSTFDMAKGVLNDLEDYANSTDKEASEGEYVLGGLDGLMSMFVAMTRIGKMPEEELKNISTHVREKVASLSHQILELSNFANDQQILWFDPDFEYAFAFWDALAEVSENRLLSREAVIKSNRIDRAVKKFTKSLN